MDKLFIVILFSVLFGSLNANKDHIHDDDSSDTLSYTYQSPVPEGFAYLAEHFDNPKHFEKQWIKSEAKKDNIDEEIAKYDGR